MSFLKIWALAVCTAAVALALCDGLLPEKSAGRAAKLVASLWLIIAVVSPITEFRDADLDGNIDFTDVSLTEEH
ncbi:MAG: hypothetical protein RRY38_04355, partial [Oscillospiraceae bacterium]